MKKLKVLGLAAIAAGMFSLTSCLDGGGNTQQLSSYAMLEIVCWLILRSILIRRIMRMPVQMVFMWRQELLLLH